MKIEKIIRRLTLISLILSLLFIMVPCYVMAEDEEGILGGSATAPVLTIIKNRDDENDDNNEIYPYKLVDNGNGYEIDYPNQISNLTVSYDEDNEMIIVDVKKNTETNLRGYLDNIFDSMIVCDRSLKFIGEGSLNIEIISNPKFHDQCSNYHFSFIKVIDSLMFGDKITNGPKVKLDTDFSSTDEYPYQCVEGVMAQKFLLANSSLTANTHSSVFYCTYVPQTMESNSTEITLYRLAIFNSSLITKLKYLNGNDNECREHHLFKYGDDTGDIEGKVLFENSNLQIEYNDPNHYLDISPSIALKKEGTLLIKDSILNFYSNTGAMFVEADKVGISKSDIKYVQEDIPSGNNVYAFNTDVFVIEDSNVDITSFCSIVSARTNIAHSVKLSQELVGDDLEKSHYISIVENSGDYSLKMYVNSEAEKPVFIGKGGIPSTTPINPFDSYIYIQTPKKGKIKISDLGGSKLNIYDMEDLGDDENVNVFKYDYDDPTLNTKDIEWNYLEITPVKKQPRHEVLNTGIN